MTDAAVSTKLFARLLSVCDMHKSCDILLVWSINPTTFHFIYSISQTEIYTWTGNCNDSYMWHVITHARLISKGGVVKTPLHLGHALQQAGHRRELPRLPMILPISTASKRLNIGWEVINTSVINIMPMKYVTIEDFLWYCGWKLYTSHSKSSGLMSH